MDLHAAIGDVRAFFEEERVPFVIVGALALHHYGHTRATSDVDLLVGAEHQERLIAFLEQRGYVTLHRSGGYSNHLHPDPAVGRLDVIYVDGETRLKVLKESVNALIGGHLVLVPKPEHLIAMKVQAIKNDPKRTFQDMADIQFLFETPGIDRDEVRRYFEQAGQLERFRELEKS